MNMKQGCKKILSFFIFLMAGFTCSVTGNAVELQATVADVLGRNTGSNVVEGKDGWLFFRDELEHVRAGKFWGEAASEASKTRKKKYADPLPAIIKYNKLLAEKGIALYLVPVPPKILVYPEKLANDISAASIRQERELYTRFYSLLQEAGVRVIDLLPVLEAAKEKPLYCQTDTHYSGEGLRLFSRGIASALEQEEWYNGVSKKEFSEKLQDIQITGDLAKMAGKEDSAERISLRFVTDSETGKQINSDIDSPVVLLGDSHTLVFHSGGELHAKGAGLFDSLSADLGFAVDLLGVKGSGVNPARIKFFQRSKKDGGYLEGKKALIWCFTAREFTGKGGWRDIPVAP